MRDLIEVYEKEVWSAEGEISEDKIARSARAEQLAEKERVFVHRRKKLIRTRLTEVGLSPQNLGVILGHSNELYFSELINGIRPLSFQDLVKISKFLKMDIIDLLPPSVPEMAEK